MIEIEYASLTATPAFIRPENKSFFYIDQNAQLFLSLYENKEKFYNDIYLKNAEKMKIRSKNFQDKVCTCGGTLRYIDAYDFWGCNNYKDTGLHLSYSGFEPNMWESAMAVSANWLTDIIDESGFKKKVKAKELLEFYESCDLEDLRTKYGFTPTLNRINAFVKAKRRSVEQEKECFEYLKTKYPKVLQQQCITFKLKDKKESFCIPDFICSDNNNVYIVDAKLDYVNDEKMTLYISLIKFILKSKKDIRPVFGTHIMYVGEVSPYMETIYALLLIPKQ